MTASGRSPASGAARITGATRVAGVIGSPIAHSLSPAILNAAFDACGGLDWVYVAFDVPRGAAAAALAAMRALDLGGLSVTMPHKADVAAAVDELTPAAAALGAVNCVVPRDGRLVGENFDGAGFLDGLRGALDVDVTAKRVVVLGAGGAARAIAWAAGRAGASAVVVVNRTSARAAAAAALAGEVGVVGDVRSVRDADIVVNATSVGMPANDTALLVDPDDLGPSQVVVDIVYHPSVTPLMAVAAARGSVTGNGVPMLVHQAAHTFRAWTGQDSPIAAMTAAAENRLNIG